MQFEVSQNPHCQDCLPDLIEESSLGIWKTDDLDVCSVSTCLPAMSETEADRIEGTEWNQPMVPEAPPLPTKLMRAASSVSTSGKYPQHGQDTQKQFAGMRVALNGHATHDTVQADASSALSDGLSNDKPEEELLIVMLKNIPCRCDQEEIMNLLAQHGWADKCNYFYLPARHSSANLRGSLGYAFVGFPETKLTRQFMHDMKGKKFPGRQSGKTLDVVPARLQAAQQPAQAARKKTQKDKAKSQAKTEQLRGNPMTYDWNNGCENMQDMTPWPWNPLQVVSSQDVWNAGYWSQFAQQSYDVEELTMQVAAAGPFGADVQWYGDSAGTTESCSYDHGQQEQAVSEVSSLSMEFEDAEEAGSELEAAARRQDNSDSEAEFKDIEQEDATVSHWHSEDGHHGAAVGNAFFDAQSEEEKEEENQELLTVMVKNIPCRCSQQDILDLLAERGWEDEYNFFHLPAPPSTCKGWRGCLGYAFVGFPDPETTHRFLQDMKGVSFPNRKSTKVIDVVPARCQGLEHNLIQFTGKKVSRSSRAPIYRREGDGHVQDVIATMKF